MAKISLRTQLAELETRCSRLQDMNAELKAEVATEQTKRFSAEGKLKDADNRVDGCQTALNTMRQALSKYEGKFEQLRELGILPPAPDLMAGQEPYDINRDPFAWRGK